MPIHWSSSTVRLCSWDLQLSMWEFERFVRAITEGESVSLALSLHWSFVMNIFSVALFGDWRTGAWWGVSESLISVEQRAPSSFYFRKCQVRDGKVSPRFELQVNCQLSLMITEQSPALCLLYSLNKRTVLMRWMAVHSIAELFLTEFKGEARNNNINLSRLNNFVKAGNERSLLASRLFPWEKWRVSAPQLLSVVDRLFPVTFRSTEFLQLLKWILILCVKGKTENMTLTWRHERALKDSDVKYSKFHLSIECTVNVHVIVTLNYTQSQN